MTLIALRNVSSLYPPTKLLFQCLAITDVGVGPGVGVGVGGTRYNGLYGEVPPERGYLFQASDI